MKFIDFNDDENFILNDDDCVLESEMGDIGFEYRCEDCDYRWHEKKKQFISEEEESDIKLSVDESGVICPQCGSTQVVRV